MEMPGHIFVAASIFISVECLYLVGECLRGIVDDYSVRKISSKDFQVFYIISVNLKINMFMLHCMLLKLFLI